MAAKHFALGRPRWISIVASGAALLVVALGGILIADARNSRLEVERLAALLRAKPGMTIAEIGAGNGWLSIAIARRVGPDGHVFSTERSLELRDAVREAAAEHGVENITVIDAGDRSTNLAADCCDGVFMRHVYHHLRDVRPIADSIRQALRQNGLLVIIECEPHGWPGFLGAASDAHSIDRDRLVREVAAAGFEFVRVEAWPGSHMYVAVFRDQS